MDPEHEQPISFDWVVGHAQDGRALAQQLAIISRQGWTVFTIVFGEAIGALNPKQVYTIVAFRPAQPAPDEPSQVTI